MMRWRESCNCVAGVIHGICACGEVRGREGRKREKEGRMRGRKKKRKREGEGGVGEE